MNLFGLFKERFTPDQMGHVIIGAVYTEKILQSDREDQERLGIEPTETLRAELLFLRAFGAVRGVAKSMSLNPLSEHVSLRFLEALAAVVPVSEDRATFRTMLRDRLGAYGQADSAAYNTEVPANWKGKEGGYGLWRVTSMFCENCGHSEDIVLVSYGMGALAATVEAVSETVSRFKVVP